MSYKEGNTYVCNKPHCIKIVIIATFKRNLFSRVYAVIFPWIQDLLVNTSPGLVKHQKNVSIPWHYLLLTYFLINDMKCLHRYMCIKYYWRFINMWIQLCSNYSPDGIYVGVGMITGSVAVYISFSLQVTVFIFLFHS